MKKITVYSLTILAVLALALTGCNPGGDETVINFYEDFALIAFDVDGDGDTTYTFDGDDLDDTINPEGGRILTYDADGDGVADQVDGKYLRLVSGRFAFDEGDSDYAGYADKLAFTADTVWYLNGTVFIGENDAQTDATRPDSTVLDIAEGTVIKGIASAATPGTLVIDRNGQIDAVGTAAAPIVFTSSKAAGSRAPGDWGGLVINGSAPIQKTTAEGEGGTGTYGGSITADNSGTISYVQVQFGGTLFTPDNELNGIAFQGVGSGTTVDYVQIHKNADDGVEFFGGSVAASHLVLTGIQDDGLDYDDGWTGSAQYVVIQAYGDGGNAIEADGDAADVIDPADPILANFSIIGGGTDNGPNFKSNAEGQMINSFIINYPTGQTALTEDTDAAKQPEIEYYGVAIEAADAISAAADWSASANGNAYAASGLVTWSGTSHIAAEADGTWSFNAKPTATATVAAQAYTSVDRDGVTAGTQDKAGNTLDAAGASFVGAVNPAGTDWTTGWTAFPAN